MPRNPAQTHITGTQSAGLLPGNLNNPKGYNHAEYNTFNRSRYRQTTERFADFKPIFADEFIEGDRIRMNLSHDTRSYTMVSPQFSFINKHRTFFQIPMQAITPNNYDILKMQPVKGSDIPGNALPIWYPGRHFLFWQKCAQALYVEAQAGFTTAADAASWLRHFLNYELMFMSIFSRDSLLCNLGYDFGDLDIAGDRAYQTLSDVSNWSAGSRVSSITFTSLSNSPQVSIEELLRFRNGMNVGFNFINDFVSGRYGATFSTSWGTSTDYRPASDFFMSLLEEQIQAFNSYLYNIYGSGATAASILIADSTSEHPFSINLRRVFAYQMAYYQYQRNSNVEDVSTGEQFLELLENYRSRLNENLTYKQVLNSNYAQGFLINGVRRKFDLCSAITFDTTVWSSNRIDEPGTASFSGQLSNYFPSFWQVLFTVKRSLRETDYFTSARLQPLAVGDNSVIVADNRVQMLDITRGLWLQRFKNILNRTSHNIYEYLKSITGFMPSQIKPQPNFIFGDTSKVNVEQVANTAGTNDLGGMTSLVSDSQKKYIFDIFNDCDSVILGCVSYSAPVVFASGYDRSFDKRTRADDFNFMLQNMGDQEIWSHEFLPIGFERQGTDQAVNLETIFGYTLRYMELKQGISRATGGFKDPNTGLRTWSFIFDPYTLINPLNLSEDYLHNSNQMLDRFYKSLTGLSPSNRFHFISQYYIQCFVNSKQVKIPTLSI